MITRTQIRRAIHAAALAGLLCSVAPAALAQAIATTPTQSSGISQEQALALSARLDALERHNEELEAQIADLKAQSAAQVQQVRDTQAAQPTVTVSNGRPTFTSADGSSKLAVRALVQFDAASYSEEPRTAANDLGSGTNFRRARLGVDGTAFKDWNYALWGEFGGSGGESAILNQAWLEYAGWKPFGLEEPIRLRVGAWAMPSGLEDATNNTEELFLERAAIAELVRGFATGDGRTGVGATARGARWYASALWSGKVVGVPATPELDQQSGFAFRAAFNPIHGPDYDVHVGANIQGILEPADTTAGPVTTQAVRLQERPELRVSGVRLVDTGAINSDGLTAYGLEAGASWKNLYGAGEWYQVDVNRKATAPALSPFDPSFSGWYLQGAWAITGEHRAWTNANGGFVGIRPLKAFDPQRGTWGAWELAARYSELDLNDHEGVAGAATPAGGIRGGQQNITTVGLNWYPNSVVRFLLDYQWTRVNRLNAAGGNIGEDVNVISFRSQFAF
ncbi:porin [Phenylobacterium sp.]|uniref:porin n=1 Tax=Phenylobacterium sp. TaxID=1871053 RepID=UPI002F40479A